MKGILKLNGKEFIVEIDENTLKYIEEPKKTGYERVDYLETYYYEDDDSVGSHADGNDEADQDFYNSANYYSNESVAKNNARADTLMRKLRRFAVEHRKTNLNWKNDCLKYYFYYDYIRGQFETDNYINCRDYGAIYFDTKETAQAALNEFKDELIWYFTEYKDSL